jgi:hypothetical protein
LTLGKNLAILAKREKFQIIPPVAPLVLMFAFGADVWTVEKPFHLTYKNILHGGMIF